jgi:hypothetical protein
MLIAIDSIDPGGAGIYENHFREPVPSPEWQCNSCFFDCRAHDHLLEEIGDPWLNYTESALLGKRSKICQIAIQALGGNAGHRTMGVPHTSIKIEISTAPANFSASVRLGGRPRNHAIGRHCQ